MGGINIYCGSFEGDDKSGSAVEGVLNGIEEMASAPQRAAIGAIKEGLLDEEMDHLLIEPDDARLLLPLLREYAAREDGQLAVPGDPFDQMARDERAFHGRETDLKYGEGLGWRAWCVRDLLKAFETADAESEEVALVW
jgi:hypothetical protein